MIFLLRHSPPNDKTQTDRQTDARTDRKDIARETTNSQKEERRLLSDLSLSLSLRGMGRTEEYLAKKRTKAARKRLRNTVDFSIGVQAARYRRKVGRRRACEVCSILSISLAEIFLCENFCVFLSLRLSVETCHAFSKYPA